MRRNKKRILVVLLLCVMLLLTGCQQSVDTLANIGQKIEDVFNGDWSFFSPDSESYGAVTTVESDPFDEDDVTDTDGGGNRYSLPGAVESNKEKVYELYLQIAEAITSGEDNVELDGTDDEISDAIDLVFRDPECFAADHFYYGGTTTRAGKETPGYCNWSWNCDDPERKLELSRQVGANIVLQAAEQPTDYEKVKYVHDWLCKYITYVESEDYTDQSMYGALVWGEAVCNGYAESFQYLISQLGFTGTVIFGTVDGDPHAWNSIVMDGEQYYMDVTWDDPDNGDEISYDWFCVDSATIGASHIPDAKGDQPASTAMADNYFVHNSLYLESWNEAQLREILLSQAGQSRLTLRCADSECCDQARQWLAEEGNLQEILAQMGVDSRWHRLDYYTTGYYVNQNIITIVIL